MSRFAQIAKGTRAVKTVSLPMPDGTLVPLGVRPLTGRELGAVLAAGRAYAIANGMPDPKDGDRLYELGQMAHTLALGCVDVGTAAEPAPPDTPFFASDAEVLDNLDPDRIVLLYEEQQAWQDECAPRPERMAQGDFLVNVLKLAGWESGQPDPLLRWRPTLRVIFTHTLASQYVALLTSKSDSTSPSDSTVTGS